MVRRYADPVDVRRGAEDSPQQFLWHGRLWKVRDVVAHWVETGPWWQTSGVHVVLGHDADPDRTDPDPVHDPVPVVPVGVGDLLAERELWRVEAGIGPTSTGVFDLSFDWADGSWQLVGCVD